MKIVALFNIKGGVGKTAAAVNLSHLASLDGHQTLIWDLDPQGAATFYFRVRAKVDGGGGRLLKKRKKLHKHIRGTDFWGLDLIPADMTYRLMDVELSGMKDPKQRLASLLEPLAGEYDLVFLDCPPSFSLTSESIFAAADLVLIPTVPTPLSLRSLDHVRDRVADHKRLAVRPFFSLVDRRKAMHRSTLEHAAAAPFAFLKSEIPYASEVEQMGVQLAPLAAYDRASRAGRAFSTLWQEVSELLF